MEVLYKRCCGLDVHKKSITACALTPEGKEIKNFGTMTEDIFALVEWIKEKGCTYVAMKRVGFYGKPIYNLLEIEDIEILVVNAQHIKWFQVERPMSKMPNGSPTFCVTSY